MRIGAVVLAGVFCAANAAAENALPADPVLLYCTGNAIDDALSASEFPSNALVQVARSEILVEISVLGFARSDKPPQIISGMEISGSATLNLSGAKPRARRVSFNLNRFDGSLLIGALAGSGGRVGFTGTCKPAKALF